MLSKIKALSSINATKEFTDRDEPRNIFFKAFNEYKNNEKKLNVLMFYGIGGIGKTSLLNDFKKSIAEECKNSYINIININLDIAAFDTSASYLLNISDQLKINHKVFDYAIYRYFKLIKRPILDSRNYKFDESSILFDLADSISQILGIFLPVKLFYKLYLLGGKKLQKMFGKEKILIEEIDSLPEKELERKLSYYLGNAINNAAANNNMRFIFFMDSLNKLTDRNFSGDEWLKELIGSAENGLYVIAGREYLKWGELDREWSNYLDQHILGELSETDADYYLSKVGINDALIKKEIIKTSHGLPLYLDLCVGIYISFKQEGRNIIPEDFKLAENDVVKNFLSNLDIIEGEALKIMAALEQFDKDFFLVLTKELNINIPYTQFNEFCNASFAIEIDEKNKIFKIHDIIRNFICKELDKDTAYKIFSIIVEYCSKNYDQYKNDKNRINWIFQQSFIIIKKFNISEIKQEHIIAIVDTGHKLIFEGYWHDVKIGINRIEGQIGINNYLSFLYATSLFMGDDIKSSIKLFENLLDKDIGKWRYHNLFYLAFCHQLLGHYNKSFDIYKEISNISATNENENKIKKAATERMSIVEVLKGNFQDAITLYNKLNFQESNKFEKMKYYIFRGDICLYNFNFSDAVKYFSYALRLCNKINSLYKKENVILNNLAEALCFTDRKSALKIAEKAIKISKQLNEVIQINRGLIIKATALTINDSDLSIELSKEALESNKNIGYKSGILLASEALCLGYIAKKQKESAFKILQNMNNLINDEIGGIFKFKPILISYILSPEKIDDFLKTAQWIDFNSTKLQIQEISKDFF